MFKSNFQEIQDTTVSGEDLPFMMANTILFIGGTEDPHIQEVDKHIKTMDSEAKVVLFNPGCGSHSIEIAAGKLGPNCTIVVDDERITAESVRSVWYRWAPAVFKADQDAEDPKDLQAFIATDFASKEWSSVIRSLASYLPHARWVNPVDAEEMINCKPHQMKLAQQVGLTVPQTNITNNPAAVGKLFEQVDHGRVIFKSLTRLSLPSKMLLTSEITKEFPTVSRSSITQCPAIYQELIERESDLRITVIGREVFVVRIASQILDEKKDRLDWRRCQDKDELYSKVQVLQ